MYICIIYVLYICYIQQCLTNKEVHCLEVYSLQFILDMSIRIHDIILGINLSAQLFKWNCKQRLLCFAYVHMLNLAIDAVSQIFNMCGKFLGPKPNKKTGRGDR